MEAWKLIPTQGLQLGLPILGDSDDGIFLEDSTIGEGDSEEDSRMKTNLEAS